MSVIACRGHLTQHGYLSGRHACVRSKPALLVAVGSLPSSRQHVRHGPAPRNGLGGHDKEGLPSEPQKEHKAPSGGQEAIKPDLSSLPNKIAVTCNGVPGEIVLNDLIVRCHCDICSQTEKGYALWDPSRWKQHCGDDASNDWTYRIKVHVAGLDRSFRTWLKSRGFKVINSRTVYAGGPPPRRIVPLEKEPAVLNEGEEEVELVPISDVLPPEFSVLCGNTPGILLTEPWMVLCGCGTCADARGRATAAATSPRAPVMTGLWTPNKWEKHCGKGSNKDSFRSIFVLPGREVKEVGPNQQLVSLETHLKRQGYKAAPPPRDGGQRMLIKLPREPHKRGGQEPPTPA